MRVRRVGKVELMVDERKSRSISFWSRYDGRVWWSRSKTDGVGTKCMLSEALAAHLLPLYLKQGLYSEHEMLL